MAERSRRRPLKQGERLAVLAVSLILLSGVCFAVSGAFIPGFDSSGLWFYSAAFGLLLGDLVVEPWYARPADTVTNASAVLLASLTASSTGLEISQNAFETGRVLCIGFAGAVLVFGVAAMVSRRDAPAQQTRFHRSCFAVAVTFGRASTIFWLFFIVTVTAAYAQDPENLFILYMAGGLLLGAQPVRLATERLIQIASPTSESASNVVVERIAEPRSAFAALTKGLAVEVGQAVIRDEEKIGVIVDASTAAAVQTVEVFLSEDARVSAGDSLELGSAEDSSDVLGAVGRGTSLERVVLSSSGRQFDRLELTEGQLVRADVRGIQVLYQVIDASVETASPEAASISKRVSVVARKVGVWKNGEFKPADWVPLPGSAVALAQVKRTKEVDPTMVGRVPGTDYGAKYDATFGATHNTAILGILGSGKTTLAVELIWRTIAADSKPKVVVVDITNEYAAHFEPLYSPAGQRKLEDEINQATAARRNELKFDGDFAGNRGQFKQEMAKRLETFFESENQLMILNPAALIVTHQDSGYRNGNSAQSLTSLTAAEVTAMISRELLYQVRGEFSSEVRACLVLEEAHSLAPEINATAHKGDQQAANTTARALMQGRKFGLGSIVITQRTASVTKSILNQCNTIFALRVYDQTGVGFLSSFIGDDYAHVLATLKDHHAVLFGKASSCKSPLMIELNHPDALADWREEIVAQSASGEDGPDDEDPSIAAVAVVH